MLREGAFLVARGRPAHEEATGTNDIATLVHELVQQQAAFGYQQAALLQHAARQLVVAIEASEQSAQSGRSKTRKVRADGR